MHYYALLCSKCFIAEGQQDNLEECHMAPSSLPWLSAAAQRWKHQICVSWWLPDQQFKQLLPTTVHNSLFWCNFKNKIFGTSQVFGTKSWIFLSFGGFRNCDVTVKGEYEHARDQIFNRLTSCFQLSGFPLKTFENFNNLFEPWWICTSSFGFYILYIWGQRSVTLTTKNHSFSHFSHWPDFCETSCPCNGF